jgi:glycosyltransferase involved in cell wall biosynthesis
LSARLPVRVLHVLPHDALAGTELMVASLILCSDPEAVQQELATLRPRGPIAERLEKNGREVRSLGGRGGLAAATWRLARLLRTREYDVVSAYGLKASLMARLLVRLLGGRRAFVCGVRGLHVTEVERLDSPKARLASLIERLFSPLVEAYDCNSRAALELLAGLGIDRERLTHIPNGLDLEQWAPRDSEPDGVPLIICAGRFKPVKRHEDLLAALAQLRRDGRSFRAVLAGGGPLLERMRRLLPSLGLDGCVELPGQLDTHEVRRLLGKAAIVCLPSASEGMPGALMEAMATRVAVVGTDVDGTNELVVDGESGLLVPAYDPAALARALARLLDDHELRRRLAEGGRRRMEDCYSLDVMLKAKERLYVGLVSPRTGASA